MNKISKKFLSVIGTITLLLFVIIPFIPFGKVHAAPEISDDTSTYHGNSTATLNYSINGVIEYTSGGGYDHGISFRINGLKYKANESKMQYTEEPAVERDYQGNPIMGDNNQPIPILDPETGHQITEKTALTIVGDTISYDATGDTVDFVFTMAPGTLMTGLTINGTEITNLPKTAEELEACYFDHTLEIPVNGIEKASTYDIQIEARYPNSDEEFMSGFLWDYNPEGYTGPDDKILHGTLTFVKAEYGGHTYTTPEQVNALGGVYIWRDALRKDSYTYVREGCGEAQFPKGTILTVKIIPDSGYQLVNFGLNGTPFEPQEEIGTYTFEVKSGPFHLQAEIAAVDDKVNAISEKVSAGEITIGDEDSMSVGTARLDVKDVELDDEKISNFEEAAEGYNVDSYLDISLYNTVYKASEEQSWDTKVDELNNDAEIVLQLEDNVNGQDIVVVHETHDGKYEIIETEYIEDQNAIVFKTDSFSNYAIATKGEVTTRKHKVEFDTNGGSEVKSVEVEDGSILERPTEPTKDGYTFGGWYVEPELNYSYDFEAEVDRDFTLYARWINNDDLKDYTVTDENGNSISFTDEEGHNYKLTMFDILSLSKEEIMAQDPSINEEFYDEMMKLLNNIAEPYGILLKLYEIEVYEDNSVTGDTTSLHEGPFKVKIKITDDIKNYNTFKLLYLKNDFTVGEVNNLTVDGDYLVGTIPHLSTYMLTGSNVTSPKTYDGIIKSIVLLGISIVGLTLVGLYTKKRLN